ncbi:MAG: nucleotide sugar dehydrogenase [Bacteroidetes Order II. Incertae sedis bacterium]|jgi:UDP-N-acetyl-D-glucosamine dehydrogenase|nr:nucleotide sugar dehydrogenase [Bacteroidetes Order II. bacterium]MBT4603277.1 nucleotide sugar dehydrogenase [Bacteroidetes Order II. bacterium]MBT6201429.1 nucleotide sugar dehydrogenase [Bacteroidetes Order II. bacterium]MBT6425681.1 nucleotide sugar dehydrogenase [Bacteroidetes Order II. bacterium]MBT6581646.1 nucleotide sugar dehydrogenase [Bacteroidetes Order II. bacterium]
MLAEMSNQNLPTLGIIGMGYVGLPLAVVFAEAGVRVIGFDVSDEKISFLNGGSSYIEDIPSSRLVSLVEAGLITGTTDFDLLKEVDAISICVPTPLSKTRDPDISYIVSATNEIAPRLKKGQTVILESTTYPGTTREVILPQLEKSGLAVGEDFFLAFSPERVDPGRDDYTTKNTPKVLGGITEACISQATTIYGRAIDTIVPVSSPEAAEMVKLLENTFRAVNIGLVNEVLLMCEKLGVDAWEVIDAAATKPFGFMKFTPGPGLGGHCIPIDPHYLSWKLKTLNYTARFIELASEVNTAMPEHWAQKVQDRLNDQEKSIKGSTVLVVGVAYKKDVSDVRESPALDIIQLLERKGGNVIYYDHHVPVINDHVFNMRSETSLETALDACDCAIIVTDHSDYDWAMIKEKAPVLVDTRNVT